MTKIIVAVLMFVTGLFGQITPLNSVSVKTDLNVIGANGGHFTYTFMAANWDRSELYVTNQSSIAVIDTNTWTVKNTISVSLSPRNLCIAPTTGTLAIPAGTPSSVLIINPADGSSRVIYTTGLPVTSGCSFSADGKRLYLSADYSNSPAIAKISVFDTETWTVVKTWATDEDSIPVIQTLPNGKVYALSQNVYNTTGYLLAVDIDGSIKKLDVGFMPTTITIATNGLAYVSGLPFTAKEVTINTDTDAVIGNLGGLIPVYYGFPTGDPWYAYVSGKAGFSSINLKTKTEPQPIDLGILNYGLAAHRLQDGSDVIAILRDGRVDIFKGVQPTTLYTVNNGASFKEGPVAPGEIVSLFGANMGNQTAVFSTVPLPTNLAGVNVVMNGGQAIPLYYVSPTQINAQIPYGITGESITLKVTTPQGTTNTLTVPVAASASAPFAGPNGETLVDASGHWTKASAVAGQVAMMFATGLGQVNPPVATGSAASLTTLSYVTGLTAVTVCGKPAQVLFSGLAPGFVGLYQINVIVPSECSDGQTENAQITVN